MSSFEFEQITSPETDQPLVPVQELAAADVLQLVRDADVQSAGYRAVRQTHEQIVNLGEPLVPHNIRLVHQARQLAYRLCGLDFERKSSKVTKSFARTQPREMVSWQAIADTAAVELPKEEAIGKALTEFLPRMAEHEDDREYIQRFICFNIYQIRHYRQTKQTEKKIAAMIAEVEIQQDPTA